jgi:hypothetical protein
MQIEPRIEDFLVERLTTYQFIFEDKILARLSRCRKGK